MTTFVSDAAIAAPAEPEDLENIPYASSITELDLLKLEMNPDIESFITTELADRCPELKTLKFDNSLFSISDETISIWNNLFPSVKILPCIITVDPYEVLDLRVKNPNTTILLKDKGFQVPLKPFNEETEDTKARLQASYDSKHATAKPSAPDSPSHAARVASRSSSGISSPAM